MASGSLASIARDIKRRRRVWFRVKRKGREPKKHWIRYCGNLLFAVALGTGAYLRLASRPSNGPIANVRPLWFSYRPLSSSPGCLHEARSGRSTLKQRRRTFPTRDMPLVASSGAQFRQYACFHDMRWHPRVRRTSLQSIRLLSGSDYHERFGYVCYVILQTISRNGESHVKALG